MREVLSGGREFARSAGTGCCGRGLFTPWRRNLLLPKRTIWALAVKLSGDRLGRQKQADGTPSTGRTSVHDGTQ